MRLLYRDKLHIESSGGFCLLVLKMHNVLGVKEWYLHVYPDEFYKASFGRKLMQLRLRKTTKVRAKLCKGVMGEDF